MVTPLVEDRVYKLARKYPGDRVQRKLAGPRRHVFGTIIDERTTIGLGIDDAPRDEAYVEYLIEWDHAYGDDHGWVLSRRLVPLWSGMSKSRRKN